MIYQNLPLKRFLSKKTHQFQARALF